MHRIKEQKSKLYSLCPLIVSKHGMGRTPCLPNRTLWISVEQKGPKPFPSVPHRSQGWVPNARQHLHVAASRGLLLCWDKCRPQREKSDATQGYFKLGVTLPVMQDPHFVQKETWSTMSLQVWKMIRLLPVSAYFQALGKLQRNCSCYFSCLWLKG